MSSSSVQKRKAHVLNQVERDTNKKVFLVYNLKQEDFENEAQYDNFLEEREGIIYNLVHSQLIEESNNMLNEFKKKYFHIIEKRNAQNLDRSHSMKQIRTLPLLGQMKYQTKARQADSAKLAMMSVRYSNDHFLSDITKRVENWKAKEEIPKDMVGGLPSSLFLVKVKEELKDSMFILK